MVRGSNRSLREKEVPVVASYWSNRKTGCLVWAERVESDGHWQDRAQAHAAMKAEASALMIVAPEVFTPERIDPADGLRP